MNLIVCMSKNRVIGKDGKMPWHIKEDLAYFKKTTMNKTIIMGRKTFNSLPFMLPSRKHVVLTRDKNFKPPSVDIIHEVSIFPEDSFVIGGGEVYKAYLPYVKRLYITLIDSQIEGDTFFPEIDYSQWNLIEETLGLGSDENYKYKFTVYERC